MLRYTEKEINLIVSSPQIFDEPNTFSINIFCDLHYVLDFEGVPTDKTFYSAIVQLKKHNEVIQNYSCVNVRDRKQVKQYRTWQSLVNAFRLDHSCTVTFRTYDLNDEEYLT